LEEEKKGRLENKMFRRTPVPKVWLLKMGGEKNSFALGLGEKRTCEEGKAVGTGL